MTGAARPKRPATVRRQEIEWIEIGAAARFSRTKAITSKADIVAGTIRVLHEDGKTLIPMSAAHRLKREASDMLALKRRSRIGDTLPVGGGRPGPHAAREKQDVLPMSSGRAGQGWLGQKPRS